MIWWLLLITLYLLVIDMYVAFLHLDKKVDNAIAKGVLTSINSSVPPKESIEFSDIAKAAKSCTFEQRSHGDNPAGRCLRSEIADICGINRAW